MDRSHSVLAAIAFLILGNAIAAGDGAASDLDAIKSAYRRPPALPVENAALADLGRALFFDPVISASGKTSCASCHVPRLGWATNEVRSTGDSGRPMQRKTQTLLGIGHARPPFDWDGRHATLEAQAVSSLGTGSMSMFATRTEVKIDDIIMRLRRNDGYVEKFNRAMPGAPITLDNVVIAIAAFERTIEPPMTPFDRWIAGDETAIPAAARRGFVLFNGKANCASCHSGWRFTDDKFHDVGTATTDRGRGRELKHDAMLQFAFKTPTLRAVALRAPYMHDGSVASLRDVVEHYVKGGIERDSRSPQMRPLDLSAQERDDLVAFMQTLTGGP